MRDVLDPSTRSPDLAGGSCSGFRPAGVLQGATGLPVGLHLPTQPNRISGKRFLQSLIRE